MSQPELSRVFPFDDPSVPYCVEHMQETDLVHVMQIERVAFPSPWPASAYRYELSQNDLSTYLVLRQRQPRSTLSRGARTDRVPRKGFLDRALRWSLRGSKPGTIVGYGGFWSVLDEAHVSTIAIHPDWRGRGLGEMMLVALIDASLLRGAAIVTLEVRVSNRVAQNLYAKYSFVEAGLRRGYYHDNNEDALIMSLSEVGSRTFQARYESLKAALRATLMEDRKQNGR